MRQWVGIPPEPENPFLGRACPAGLAANGALTTAHHHLPPPRHRNCPANLLESHPPVRKLRTLCRQSDAAIGSAVQVAAHSDRRHTKSVAGLSDEWHLVFTKACQDFTFGFGS